MTRASKLTPAVHKHIVEAVRSGNFFTVACRSAQISEKTGHEWLARGDGTDPDRPSEPIYEKFANEVRKAEVEAEMNALKIVVTSQTPAAQQWYLERKFPERWGRREKLEHTGPNDGPIVVSSQDIEAATKELTAWREQISAGLSTPSAPDSPATSPTNTE